MVFGADRSRRQKYGQKYRQKREQRRRQKRRQKCGRVFSFAEFFTFMQLENLSGHRRAAVARGNGRASAIYNRNL